MRKGDTTPAEAPRQTLRLDKWLWQARFFKTRGLAAALVAKGRVRVNGQPAARASRGVGPGDGRMGLSSAQWLVFRLEPVLSHTSLGHQRNAELHRALHP